LKKSIEKFHIYQACGFFISGLSTLFLIKFLGKESYGNYAYYFAIGELVLSIILLGYEQSITHFKNFQKLNNDQIDNVIFNSKIIPFLLIFPILIFLDNLFLSVFLFIIILLGIFDRSYLFMARLNLNTQAFLFFMSKLLLFLGIFCLSFYDFNFSTYLFLYVFTYFFYVITGLIFINNFSFVIYKIDISNGFRQFLVAFPFGSLKIFIYFEAFVVLSIIKTISDTSFFGLFMIFYSISKLISGICSIFITPVYKNLTLNKLSVSTSFKIISTMGLIFFIFSFIFIGIIDFDYFLSFFLNHNFFINDIIFKSLIYSITLYTSSAIYSILFLAKNKIIMFYLLRFIFLLLLLIQLTFFPSFIDIFYILIISELLIIFISYFTIRKFP
jgi:hypothetical protein